MSETTKVENVKGVQSNGILHFTISVRDHEKAAQFYADLLGCEIQRVTDHFAFMRTGKDYFVLAKMAGHVNPNPPKGTHFHHAFIVSGAEFDRARDVIASRGIEELFPRTVNHKSFPGRHLYFHDPDGNGVEITDVVG